MKRKIILDILASFLFLICIFLLNANVKILQKSIKVYEFESDNKTFIYSHILNVDIELLETIKTISELNEVDYELVLSLIYYESRFNQFAFNDNNLNGSIDYGIMQLNNRTFPEYTAQQLFHLETNINLGVSYLKWCLDEAGTMTSALAYYNCGIGATNRNNVPESTVNYMSKIIEKRKYLLTFCN